MANTFGLKTFKQGIVNYLQANKFSNAKQDDLWEALTNVSHTDGVLSQQQTVKEIMDTWTLQMGFPVVNVRRDYGQNDDCSFCFDQQRFLLYEDKNMTEAEIEKGLTYRWWIPISYTTPNGDFSDTKPKIWLSPNDPDQSVIHNTTIQNDEALIVNVQQTGFYRVNYDLQNWKLIEKALQANYTSIHRTNRAQILNDAFSLAQAGLLDYSTALSLTRYLQQEDDFIPWYSVLRVLGYLDLMLGRTAAYGDFKKYIIGELKSTYNRLAFVPNDNDSFLDVQLRKLVINEMCSLGYKDCTIEGNI